MVLNLLVDFVGVHVADSVETNDGGVLKYGRQVMNGSCCQMLEKSVFGSSNMLRKSFPVMCEKKCPCDGSMSPLKVTAEGHRGRSLRKVAAVCH